MNSKILIQEIIFDSLKNINEGLSGNKKLEITPETPLYGIHGTLDSMALVNLILEVEDTLNTKFNTKILIVDEKALAKESSPFKTVAAFVNYVAELVNNATAYN